MLKRDRSGFATAGFTLLERWVVIAIISLLAVALLPSISQAMWRAEETGSQVRMVQLATGIDAFEQKYGVYPPDDFRVVLPDRLPIKAKVDSVNSGIESLVIYLSWKNFGGISLDEHEDWLKNTDGDDNEAMIPLLDRSDKVEIVDAWGTPFAYFHNRNYSKAQSIMLAGSEEGDGETQTVRARKNPRSAGYLSPRKYQLISAGKDLEFGTPDDLVHPPLPIEN